LLNKIRVRENNYVFTQKPFFIEASISDQFYNITYQLFWMIIVGIS